MGDPPAAASLRVYLGSIQEFKDGEELFSMYVERMELFFVANDVPEDKQATLFLTMVGGKTYHLLANLVVPKKPKEMTLAEIKTTLQKHYEPKPIVIAERFHFHQRSQAMGESVADYMAELRRLTTHCAYGTHLNEALRDRLVCGLTNVAIQKRLLGEVDLTLEKAMEIAQGMEAAEKNAKTLKGKDPAVHAVNPGGTTKCFRCAKPGHDPKECRHRDAECHKCKKKGHIAPACRSSKPSNPKSSQRFTRRKKETPSRGEHYVQATEDDSGSDLNDVIHAVGGTTSTPIKVSLRINGKQHEMELDTGAACLKTSTRNYSRELPLRIPQLN